MRSIIYLLIVLSSVFQSVGQQKPNIVLIITDDQGMEMLGCYGDKNAATPNIDQLANEGIKFNKAYCTTPSCSPSRSVILTGLHNHRNGQYGLGHSSFHFRTHETVLSLPVLLSQLGYTTLQAGKMHVYPKELYQFDQMNGNNGDNAVKMTKNVAEMFKSVPSDKPFFLYFATTDPHHAGGPNPKLPYAPDRFGNKDEGHEGVKDLIIDPKNITVPAYLPNIPEAKAELSQYYQSINRIDQGIGALVELLKAKGVYDNTIILFTSDNGAPFFGAKGNLYEPGVRLPFVIKTLKSGVKNKTCNAFVSFADITPTILDIAGLLPQAIDKMKNNNKKEPNWEYIQTDTAFHGKSIKSIIDGSLEEIQKEIFLSHSFHELHQFYPMRSIVNERYKLIWNLAYQLPKHKLNGKGESIMTNAITKNNLTQFGLRQIKDMIQRPEFELYDLKNDPNEILNLAYKPENKALLQQLKSKIIQFQVDTNDPFLKLNQE